MKMFLEVSIILKLMVTLNLMFSKYTKGQIAKCDKTPLEQSSAKIVGDNGFGVSLNGNPQLYRPNQMYTVTLQGNVDEGETPKKFQDFLIVAEPHNPLDPSVNLGKFNLMPGDSMTMFSHSCSHAVEATSSTAKSSVQVLWTAPPRGSGCIHFKAMLVERPNVWYMDDGFLTYSLCEDETALSEATVVQECCTCDEAKYEAIFEGIWSRHTHPKDFPYNEWQTQFSTIIGASHSVNYTLWDYGKKASAALQDLAERGVTRALESQMKYFSKSIRSVIKAQGLQQRSNIIGRTFAVFRVDMEHHLLSFVSKMIPSPDWIVGISKENLCTNNCSWVRHRVIDLYPWDIGTESGLRYDSPSSPTMPRGLIRRITSSNPNTNQSPFWDSSSAPMKPTARLHIIRQRVYPKACPQGQNSPLENMNSNWRNTRRKSSTGSIYPIIPNNEMNNDGRFESRSKYDQSSYLYDGERRESEINYFDNSNLRYPSNQNNYVNNHNAENCKVSPWTPWTACSQTCEIGSRSRNRRYLGNGKTSNCRKSLFEKETCGSSKIRCKQRNYLRPGNTIRNKQFTNSKWFDRGLESEGLQNGFSDSYDARNYSDKHVTNFGKKHKNSNTNSYGNSYLYPNNRIQEQEILQSKRLNGAHVGISSPNCAVSPWGEWSDCSEKCNRGSRTRTRHYLDNTRSLSCTEELFSDSKCFGNDPNCNDVESTDWKETNIKLKKPASYLNMMSPESSCNVAAWSKWSPCSSSCDQGTKLRTRLFLVPFVENRRCDVLLFQHEKCYSGQPCYDTNGMVLSDDESVKNKGVLYQTRSNLGRDFVYSDHFENLSNMTLNAKSNIDPCHLPKDPGPCRGRVKRWYYDSKTKLCYQFIYSSCHGNKNNFASKAACLEKCQSKRMKLRNRNTIYKQIKSLSFIKIPQKVKSLQSESNCEVGPWSEWSNCSVSCGNGWKHKIRSITKFTSKNGSKCSKKLSKRKRCRFYQCISPADTRYFYDGSWRKLNLEAMKKSSTTENSLLF